MSSINGVDSLIINAIRAKTEKKVVTGTEKLKVTSDKHDEDREKQQPQQKRPNIKKAIRQLNAMLKENQVPLQFQIIEMPNQKQDQIRLVDSNNKVIFTDVPYSKIYLLIHQLENLKGFTVDHLI